MNYYNPYMNFSPAASIPAAKTGLLSGIFKNGLNWGSILTNTQKTLGIVNQAIPVIKQVSPVLKNAKTMFKIMNEFKRVDTPVSTTNQKDNVKNVNTVVKKDPVQQDSSTNENIASDGPTFFM